MSFVVKSISSTQYKIKVVNRDGSLLVAPGSVPVVAASSISDLVNYSNTQQMLANDATTYANAIAFAANAAANAYANAIAYTSNSVANLTISAISDVVLSTIPPANNSTLVYSSANNKYVVKQLDLDGGNF